MAQDKETPIPVCRKIRKPEKRVFQRFPGNGGGGAGRQSVSGQPGAGMPGEKGRPAAYWRRMCALESACENTRAEDARDVPGIAIASQKPGLRAFGGEGEAGALHISALLTAGDEYLADGNAVFVEDEEPSLPVHGHPSLPPAVYIGSLPSKTDENQVPFVLIQDLGGSLLSDKVQSVKIAFRCAVKAEDIEDACEDLHNLMSRVASYCAGTQTVPLEGRYRLGFWEGDRLIDWGRPDGQAQPYQEGVILTRWELPAGI